MINQGIDSTCQIRVEGRDRLRFSLHLLGEESQKCGHDRIIGMSADRGRLHGDQHSAGSNHFGSNLPIEFGMTPEERPVKTKA